ncbi:MAG: hypothetical protein QXU63_07605, partial [Nitrososphaerota archaeon]
MLDESAEIIDEIIKLTKEVDSNVSGLNREVHGLQVVPDFALVLRHEFLKRGPLPQKYIMKYDYLVLLLAELGLIRAIRYIGKVDKLRHDTTLKIGKLRLQRDETSKLGQELIGSFITQGEIEAESNEALQQIYPILLNLIRPLTRVKLYKDKIKFAAIFPAHFSLVSLPVYESHKRTAFLSPSSMLTLIDYSYAHEKIINILGYKNIRCLITKSYVISCKPISLPDSATNPTDIIKCIPIGPYRTIIPLIDRVNERLREEYCNRQEMVLTNLLGIWVFEERPFMLCGDSRGYLLALDEIPYIPEVEAFAIFGESSGISLDRLKISYRPAGSSMQTSSNNHDKLTLYANIHISKEFISRYNGKVRRLIHFLLSGKGFNARDQIPSGQIFWKEARDCYMC